MSDDIQKTKNFGPKSKQWLHDAGIHMRAYIEQPGSVAVYRRVKALYPDKVSLNMLWALEGLLLNLPFNMLSDEVKDDLLRELGSMK